ncbi:MAG: DUF4149 domain-containing protein [Nitrospiraceae bacterium]
MPIFWFGAVSLHILAAITWIGGMTFLSFVLAPLVRKGSATPEFMAIFLSAARRFRIVVWLAMGVLLATGLILLSQRHIDFMNPATWSPIVTLKLGLVALLILLTLLHDLALGPWVSEISTIPESARTRREHNLVWTARWLPRLSLLIALAVILVALVLARS